MAKPTQTPRKTTSTKQLPAPLQKVPMSIMLTTAVAVIAGLLFVKPFFGTIMFSALIAFTFNPVYRSVLRRTKRSSIALTATMLTVILSIIIPLAIVTGVTVAQANSIVSNFESGNVAVGPAAVNTVVDQGTDRVNRIVQALPGGESFNIDKAKVSENLEKLSTKLVEGIINFIQKASGAFFGLITTFILAFFLIVGMLRYQVELIDFLKKLSPFHTNVTAVYLAKAGAMTKAMVKGQLIIATAQGIAAAASLWLVGLNYFGFFAVVLTFMSFIPLGAGIITIPIGVILMLTGNIPQGAFIILFHIFGVSNIDNILRPMLVPKSARLNPALTLLAVFAGLAIFGAPGVIYGPVIMIIIIITLQMYADYNHRTEKPLPPTAMS